MRTSHGISLDLAWISSAACVLAQRLAPVRDVPAKARREAKRKLWNANREAMLGLMV
jgi:hypothetical protein